MRILGAAFLLFSIHACPGWSQDPAPTAESFEKERSERLAASLTDAMFTGSFTVDGEADAVPKPESYRIKTCSPLPEPNRYRFVVAIKYGDVNGEFPMDLTILWAGATPVITLDQLWIPGLGTFSSRVLLHEKRYAGTWQHGDHGGHLFGKIEKATDR